jgi:C-terminal processing protease CtpA/Prc
MKINFSFKKFFIPLIIILVVFFIGFSIGRDATFKNLSFSNNEELPAFNQDLFWQVWSLIKKNYVKQPVNDEDLFYGVLKGLVLGINDPYSVFFRT